VADHPRQPGGILAATPDGSEKMSSAFNHADPKRALALDKLPPRLRPDQAAIQETIDRALESKGLLLPGLEPPPEIVALNRDIAAMIDRLKNGQRGLSLPGMLGLDAISRVAGPPALKFVIHAGRILFVVVVSDPALALPIVEAELRRIGFVGVAEIGHYDTIDNVCRTYYPASSATPLSIHCLEVLKGSGLLPPNKPQANE